MFGVQRVEGAVQFTTGLALPTAHTGWNRPQIRSASYTGAIPNRGRAPPTWHLFAAGRAMDEGAPPGAELA